MDADTLALLCHHVREDAWAAWEALYPDEPQRQQMLGTALRVEGDPKGAAAWVLETVCGEGRKKAALASGGQVRRMKDGGEELEFFHSSSAESVSADDWCARAAALRAQLQAAGRARARSMSVPVEAVF